MADSENLEIKITSTVDGKGLDEAQKQIDALGESASEASEGMEKLGEASESVGDAAEGAAKDVDAVEKSVSKLGGTAEDAGEAADDMAGNLEEAGKAAKLSADEMEFLRDWIRQVIAEAQNCDSVEEAFERVRVKMNETGADSQKSGGSIRNAMGTVGVASNVLKGNFAAAATGATRLAQAFGVLQLSAGKLMLVFAAIQAAAWIFNQIKTSIEETKREAEAFKLDQIRKEIDSTKESHKLWNDEVKRSNELSKQADEHLSGMIELQKKLALAVNESNRVQALANAQSDEERRQINETHDRLSNTISGEFDGRAGKAAMERLANEKRGIENTLAGIENQQGVVEGKYAKTRRDIQQIERDEVFRLMGFERLPVNMTPETLPDSYKERLTAQAKKNTAPQTLPLWDAANSYSGQWQDLENDKQPQRDLLLKNRRDTEQQALRNQTTRIQQETQASRTTLNQTLGQQQRDAKSADEARRAEEKRRDEDAKRAAEAFDREKLEAARAAKQQLKTDADAAQATFGAAGDKLSSASSAASAAEAAYRRDRSLGNKTKMESAQNARSEADAAYQRAAAGAEEAETKLKSFGRELDKVINTLAPRLENQTEGMSPFSPAPPPQGYNPATGGNDNMAGAVQDMAQGADGMVDEIIGMGRDTAAALGRGSAEVAELRQQIQRAYEVPASA